MADKYKVKCVRCGKAETFLDEKAITYLKWRIIAWNVGENVPLVICDTCNKTDK